MATLKEQIEAAKLAEQQKVNPLKQRIDAAKKAEKSGGEKFMEGAYKSMFPKWLRENTPVGAVANTVSGAPQAIVDTANMLPTIAEWRSPFIKSGSMGRIPDVPLPAPESSTFGRTAAEWATPVPGAKFDKIADTLIGLSAATGKEMSDEIGEVTGGLGATGIAFLNALRGKATTPGDKASNLLLDNAGTEVGAEQAAKNIENALAQGEIGTAAELAKSEGMFAVENIIGKPGTQASRDIQNLTNQRSGQIIDEAENIIGGDGDALALAAARRNELVNRGKAKINQAENIAVAGADEIGEFQPLSVEAYQDFQKAQQEANQAANVVDTPYKPSEASEQLSETYSESQKTAKLNEETGSSPAWSAFDGAEPVTANTFKKSVTNWANDNLTQTDAKMLRNKFGQTLDLIDDLDKEVSPKEIQSIISEIKRINNNASSVGGEFTSANKFLGDLQKDLEKQLELVDETGDLYTAARQATLSEKTRFEPSRIGKERKLREGETLGKRITDIDEGGSVVGKQVVGSQDPALIGKYEEYIKSIAKKKGIDEKFLDNYDELLDNFPQLKADLEIAKMAQDDLVSAEEKLVQANKADVETGKRLTKAVEQKKINAQKTAKDKKAGLRKSVDKLAFNQLRKEPEKFLDKALSDENPKTLTKLARQFSQMDGGSDALRVAVRDRFLKKINKSQTGESTVSLQSVGEFHKMKDNLIDSGVMTKDEVAEIEKLMDRAKLSGMRKTSGKLMLNSVEDSIADAKASIASIAALEALPNSTNQLMLANTVKRFFKKKFDDSTSHDKSTLLALEDMITNPQKLLDAIADEGIRSQEHLEQYLNKTIRATTQSVAEDKEE